MARFRWVLTRTDRNPDRRNGQGYDFGYDAWEVLEVNVEFPWMNEVDRRAIGDLLRAVARGPYFDDWEFATLFGLEREEIAAIADAWPEVSDKQVVRVAIANALNNLHGYPHVVSPGSAGLTMDGGAIGRLLLRWQEHEG